MTPTCADEPVLRAFSRELARAVRRRGGRGLRPGDPGKYAELVVDASARLAGETLTLANEAETEDDALAEDYARALAAEVFRAVPFWVWPLVRWLITALIRELIRRYLERDDLALAALRVVDRAEP